MGKEGHRVNAHLMQRAGFGGPFEELERHMAKGYDTTVS
jgi:hypothetical protein